jgi:hypothetical protein
MYLLQGLIFCAVVGSNIHWQWTPDQYLASGDRRGLGLDSDAHRHQVARSMRPLVKK